MSLPIESRFVHTGEVRTHYHHRDGDGPAVVFLPGGMLDTSVLTWKETLRLLPPHYRLFCPDLPGYGFSDSPPDLPYTTEFFIQWLDDFLDALDLDQVVLCGSSMSGAITLGYTLRHPHRVDAIVLSGAYGYQSRVPLHEAAYALARIKGIDVIARTWLRLHPLAVRLALPISVRSMSRVDEQFVQDAYAGVRQPHALTAFIKWMRSEILPHHVVSNYTSRLPEITHPALILHGKYDWMMPASCARAAAERLPHAELHVFPGAGHLVPREWPYAAAHRIRTFLDRVERGDVPAPPLSAFPA